MQGAFILVGNNNFGYPLLVVMAVGVLTYACWRFWEGITGQGSDDAFGPYKNFFRYRLSPCVSVSPASVHDAPRMPCWVSSHRSVGSTAAVCNNPICNHHLQFQCVAAADSTTQLMGQLLHWPLHRHNLSYPTKEQQLTIMF